MTPLSGAAQDANGAGQAQRNATAPLFRKVTDKAHHNNSTHNARVIDQLEAEHGALRHVLSDGDTEKMAALKIELEPEKFHDPNARTIANVLWQQYEAGAKIDSISIGPILEKQDKQAFDALFDFILPTPEDEPEWKDCLHTVISTKPQKRRFTLRSLQELAARPPREHLIEGALYADGTSLLTAKQATFKTFFALDMGLCIATGKAWHGRSVKQGAVVYVAGEGAAGIVSRVRAWCVEHDCDFPADFHIIDEPAQIADPSLLLQFIETVSAVSPRLIVLDTLARCAVGLDENSAKDMGAFVEAVRLLAERTKAHVMTVHHNNKSGEYRGSTALVAAVDSWISLERPEHGDYVTMRFEKVKDDEAPTPLVFEKHSVMLDNYGRDTSLIFRSTSQGISTGWRLSSAEEKVLAEIAHTFGDGGATVAEWKRSCMAVGVAERTFQLAKNHLAKLKMVECPEPGKRGKKWSVTPKGEIMTDGEEAEESEGATVQNGAEMV
jgi:hypothetical protein